MDLDRPVARHFGETVSDEKLRATRRNSGPSPKGSVKNVGGVILTDIQAEKGCKADIELVAFGGPLCADTVAKRLWTLRDEIF